jgi:hypothetical protein
MTPLPGGGMIQSFLDKIDPILGIALFILVLVILLLGRRTSEDRRYEG